MVALVQRVKTASVAVEGRIVGAIGPGLLVLLGVHRDDTDAEARWLAEKVARLRVFPDEDGRMNRSLLDIGDPDHGTGGDALVVSQFTLYGDVQRGNRPSFAEAALPEAAERLYEAFVARLAGHLGKPVPTGRFGAMMEVALVNDGPVTLWIERGGREERGKGREGERRG